MASKSNDQGRSFEYVFINTLYDKLSKIGNVNLLQDEHYKASERASLQTSPLVLNYQKRSADVAADAIFKLEPLLSEDSNDEIVLCIQPDGKGEEGDVRDIVIKRKSIRWEIGLSLKNNHFAVKHSRLSKGIDFGAKWYSTNCSSHYWDEVNPIFDKLASLKGKITWSSMSDKVDSIYLPILNAFVDEIKRAIIVDKTMPHKMVEYLLGKDDFYKIISIDREKRAEINSFNLRGTLNQKSSIKMPEIAVPIVNLPTRLIYIGIMPNSTNTVEMLFDEGWSFSFRIHNASTMVEPSLKFDIQFVGVPTTIISINCRWYQD